LRDELCMHLSCTSTYSGSLSIRLLWSQLHCVITAV
jgi:hypothetical protein